MIQLHGRLNKPHSSKLVGIVSNKTNSSSRMINKSVAGGRAPLTNMKDENTISTINQHRKEINKKISKNMKMKSDTHEWTFYMAIMNDSVKDEDMEIFTTLAMTSIFTVFKYILQTEFVLTLTENHLKCKNGILEWCSRLKNYNHRLANSYLDSVFKALYKESSKSGKSKSLTFFLVLYYYYYYYYYYYLLSL